MLAATDFRLKYFDAAFSYAWALLRPAILFCVLWLIFGGITGSDEGVTHYPAYLVLGIVIWTFFSQTANASLWSLTRRADLLRKLPVPRLAVPFSTELSCAFDLALNLVIAFVVLVVSGVAPRLTWLEIIPLLAVVILFAAGVSLALSAGYVRFRDVDQLWAVAGQALFFLTPIFYVVTHVPSPFDRVLVLANPLATVTTQARHALVDSSAPSAAAVAGGYWFLLVPLGVTAATVWAGAVIFRHESPKAAEYV
jgi:ABC-2 type transport system permease protein